MVVPAGGGKDDKSGPGTLLSTDASSCCRRRGAPLRHARDVEAILQAVEKIAEDDECEGGAPLIGHTSGGERMTKVVLERYCRRTLRLVVVDAAHLYAMHVRTSRELIHTYIFSIMFVIGV